MSKPLPRYTDQPIHHDPLDIALAQREAANQTAREAIAQGRTHADPVDRVRLRGIPVVGGCSGTSPGTDPHHETCRRNDKRTT